ncbi:MAG: NAD(P)-dependent oxidoreductase, partial [Phenylobacterium sp.]
MADANQKFVTVPHAGPAKAAASERVHGFDEIYASFRVAEGTRQSSRCAQCGVPFCQSGCPLQNNIPDWLRLAAEGRVEEAWRLSEATSAMPEICGRICPQDRLCEGAC